MSSDNENAEIIATYAAFTLDRSVTWAAITFFVYDFAATFDREGLAFFSINLGCHFAQWMNAISEYSMYIPFAGEAVDNSTFRLPQSLTPAASTGSVLRSKSVEWALFETPALDPIFGCAVSDIETQQNNIIYSSYDHHLAQIRWRIQELQASLCQALQHWFLRHIVGECTLFILNSLHLIFSATSIFVETSGAASELTHFTDPLTAILIYHFILDLQEANKHNIRIGSDDPELQSSCLSSQSSLSFVDRALGSLGSTIIPGTRAAIDNDCDGEMWDVDHQASKSDSGGVADHANTLDDLAVEPEPNSEIQEVLRDEPLAREV
ncbi:hypothetical protein C8Q80DRAFT_1121205 [Daedaleopsis nitida]|nr:hypothetical protein C8Q80DRAFT_1121205 [Daedaleopsis nitida]